MEKTNLLLKLNLEYELSSYVPLKELSRATGFPENPRYNKETKLYAWVFPIDCLPKLCALLGHQIVFEKIDLANLISYLKESQIDVDIPKWKGIGDIAIERYPKLFIVTWVQRKEKKVIKVPLELVCAVWSVVVRQPLGVKVKTITVEENYCNELGITRFNRLDSGTFDAQKFNGSREDYFHFYGAIKVLQHYFKAVDHIQSGKIVRLLDNISLQETLI